MSYKKQSGLGMLGILLVAWMHYGTALAADSTDPELLNWSRQMLESIRAAGEQALRQELLEAIQLQSLEVEKMHPTPLLETGKEQSLGNLNKEKPDQGV